MDDTLLCPICGQKFRNTSGKINNNVVRTCSGINHFVRLISDKASQKVSFIKFSLDHQYSKYLEINYLQQICRIHCMNNSQSEYIDLPKILDLDFPDLNKVKEKVSLYVILS